MLGFGAIGEFAIGQAGATAAETITVDKWFVALSEPVRVKPGLKAQTQPYFSFFPLPLVSFGWFGALSEPVRQKPINPAALRQDFFMQMAPSPFVATGWFNWLSEPVRLKPGLRAHLQPVTTQDPRFIPDSSTLIEGWFNWLSEPKRFPKGLSVQYQPDYTAHPRILPSPNVTVIINTKELNTDKATFAVNVVKSNPPATAKVSIIEIGNGLSATSVIEH